MSSLAENCCAECLPASWLATRLAVDPAMIDAMRRAGELVAYREPGSTRWSYPPWQFENGKPRHSIPRITKAAREAGVDDARLYTILTAPLGMRSGKRVYDLLHEGRDDDVVELVRAG